MVCWPGDPAPRLESLASMEAGDICNVTKLHSSVHVGTHMDAPRHFLRDGVGMEEQDLEALLGRARVIAIEDATAIRRAELERHGIQAGERLLFKTRNSPHAWNQSGFAEDFVYLSDEGARYLVERGVRTIGIDYLSIGGFRHDTVETHVTILGAGISVIEGLNLDGVAPGEYELLCLPIRIDGADGAPCRAILRSLD
jgi:arylformamidase